MKRDHFSETPFHIWFCHTPDVGASGVHFPGHTQNLEILQGGGQRKSEKRNLPSSTCWTRLPFHSLSRLQINQGVLSDHLHKKMQANSLQVSKEACITLILPQSDLEIAKGLHWRSSACSCVYRTRGQHYMLFWISWRFDSIHGAVQSLVFNANIFSML